MGEQNKNKLDIEKQNIFTAYFHARQILQKLQVNSECLHMCMETSKKIDHQLAELERQLRQLKADFNRRLKHNGSKVTPMCFAQHQDSIRQLELKIADHKSHLQTEINSSSNMLRDKDPLESKEEIISRAVIIDGYKEEQFTLLEAKIRSRQDSMVTIEEMLARLVEQSEDRLGHLFQEMRLLRKDINSIAERDDHVPKEYKERINNKQALINDLQESLPKLELACKSDQILEKDHISKQLEVGNIHLYIFVYLFIYAMYSIFMDL